MNTTKLVSDLRYFADGGADAATLSNLLTQAAGVIEANLAIPERTEFPHWKVAQFWSSSDPTKKVLMVTQDPSEMFAWPKRTDFIGWAGHSDHIYLWEVWLRKTEWVQDQRDTFPMAMPGQHRADVLREEIERLRKHTSMFDPDDAQLDEALATFLANHTNLNEDGIDQKAMSMALALNYAALKPVPKSDVQEWIANGYNPQLLQFDSPECDGTDAAHPAFHRGSDYALLTLVGKIEEILDGKDTGTGKANEPWESARQRLIKLVKDYLTRPAITEEQAIIITAFTGTMCVPKFSTFAAAVEKRLGRPVMTHEFASESVEAEIREAFKADFLSLFGG